MQEYLLGYPVIMSPDSHLTVSPSLISESAYVYRMIIGYLETHAVMVISIRLGICYFVCENRAY